jgi:hypothetical protein
MIGVPRSFSSSVSRKILFTPQPSSPLKRFTNYNATQKDQERRQAEAVSKGTPQKQTAVRFCED